MHACLCVWSYVRISVRACVPSKDTDLTSKQARSSQHCGEARSPLPTGLLDYMLFYRNPSNPSDWWRMMQPSQSASFKDQVHSLTFRVVCYTGEPDPSRLAWKFTVSWSLYSVKPERKMSILFKATLYVCSHDHSYVDIRAVQCCKTTDLSVQMNWTACNAWQCAVLAHIEIDYTGQAGWGDGGGYWCPD